MREIAVRPNKELKLTKPSTMKLRSLTLVFDRLPAGAPNDVGYGIAGPRYVYRPTVAMRSYVGSAAPGRAELLTGSESRVCHHAARRLQ